MHTRKGQPTIYHHLQRPGSLPSSSFCHAASHALMLHICRVAGVAVRVAAFWSAATSKNTANTRVCAHKVAEVAVAATFISTKNNPCIQSRNFPTNFFCFRLRSSKNCYLCYPTAWTRCGARLCAGSSCLVYCYPHCYLCYPDYEKAGIS